MVLVLLLSMDTKNKGKLKKKMILCCGEYKNKNKWDCNFVKMEKIPTKLRMLGKQNNGDSSFGIRI